MVTSLDTKITGKFFQNFFVQPISCNWRKKLLQRPESLREKLQSQLPSQKGAYFPQPSSQQWYELNFSFDKMLFVCPTKCQQGPNVPKRGATDPGKECDQK